MVRVGLRPIAGIEGIQTECNKDAANAVFEEHPEFEIPHVCHDIRESNHQRNHEIVPEPLGNLIDVAADLPEKRYHIPDFGNQFGEADETLDLISAFT